MRVYGAVRVEASFKQDVNDSLHFRTDLRVSSENSIRLEESGLSHVKAEPGTIDGWDHFIEGRFLSVHGPIQNLFRVGRHHLKAAHHRLLRDRAFSDWREVTCVC